MTNDFKPAGELRDIKIIAIGRQIRELPILRKRFGRGRWRKLKGVADVALSDGRITTGGSSLVRSSWDR